MNKAEQFWSGQGGTEYTARNRVDWRARIPFWAAIIEKTGARSMSEFGCNAGWNLSAIKRAYPDVAAYGIDINVSAAYQARDCGLEAVSDFESIGKPHSAELVFTAGVLIHIPPDQLPDVMRKIADASYDYVLAVEYASHSGQEEEVNYRGEDGLLWRRDYGALYQAMGLELVETGDAGSAFDRCQYWLMRKL